jgi:stress response protein YsnF
MRHTGRSPSQPSVTLRHTGRSPAQPSVTRSEEEVRVGTERVGTGQTRLNGRVETEHVQVPVELRRDMVAVERERSISRFRGT